MTQYVVNDGSRSAFQAFVAAQAPSAASPAGVGPHVWSDVVARDVARMSPTGVVLTSQPGFQMIDQRGHIEVGSAWADPSDDTAAGLVRADDGTSYYVLARRFDHRPAQYVVVPQAGNGTDLEAFLHRARQRYARVK